MKIKLAKIETLIIGKKLSGEFMVLPHSFQYDTI